MSTSTFSGLALDDRILRALRELGYDSPTAIQSATIPLLLSGRDVLGLAQTGTGKTAAFALPILSRIDLSVTSPQALVLAPTRELAMQVADAFGRYGAQLPGLRVLPVYGGQSYAPQLQGLRRGAHVVVGTPGRLIDHLRRGSLDLSALRIVVLDEADEMLRMGFVEDVETMLQAMPERRQVALFSATMPPAVRAIVQTYTDDPAEVRTQTAAPAGTRQRYWCIDGTHKLDALSRILEVEPVDTALVFARTKQATEQLAGQLRTRGFAAAALNGDISQPQRERIVADVRSGRVTVLVATDVAARGLDIGSISHVVNYEIPQDTESYIHRIGRTGRAGRSGEAILFIAARERGRLRGIEKATGRRIRRMELPEIDAVNERRAARFTQAISDALEHDGLEEFQRLIERYEQTHDVPAAQIAAALARMAHGRPLLLDAVPTQPARPPQHRRDGHRKPAGRKPRHKKAVARS